MTKPFRKTPEAVLSVYILLVSAFSLAMQGTRAMQSEAGGIEIMSAYAWFCALMLFAATHRRAAFTTYWYGTLILLGLLARELDLDKAFFAEGILGIKHYAGPAPLWQKALGGAVVISVLTAVFMLLRRGLMPLLRGIWAGQRAAWLIIAGFGLTVLGKSMDGLSRKLRDVGVELSTRANFISEITEESVELVASVCVMLAVSRLPLRASESRRD